MPHAVEHLLVGRHGSYNGGGSNPGLSQSGQAQAAVMAQAILDRMPGLQCTILSSTAARAAEFAKIMAELLGVEAQKHECFRDDSYHLGGEPECRKLMLACTTPVLIVVSHKDLTSGLIGGFTGEAFGKRHWPAELSYGQYWHVQNNDSNPVRLP